VPTRLGVVDSLIIDDNDKGIILLKTRQDERSKLPDLLVLVPSLEPYIQFEKGLTV